MPRKIIYKVTRYVTSDGREHVTYRQACAHDPSYLGTDLRTSLIRFLVQYTSRADKAADQLLAKYLIDFKRSTSDEIPPHVPPDRLAANAQVRVLPEKLE